MNNDFADLYLAICYAQLAQTDKAEVRLLRLQNIDNQSLAQAARWHLALCFLQDGRLAEAKTLLEGLKNDLVFGDAAKAALAKL